MSVEVVEYDPGWPRLFAETAAPLRAELDGVALRIDHIGSTAVPALAAKPVIDIHIAVASFEPLEAYQRPLEALGYVFHPDNAERTKRFFREPPDTPRTHLHVRVSGSFSEQLALLFRDFVRTHPAVAEEYAALKHALAQKHADDRQAYTDAKDPFIWRVIREADAWAQATGWQPAPSDA